MRKLMRVRMGVAVVLAAAISAALGGGVRGQSPASTPLITPPIDAAMLEQATAKGQAMLAKAKWKVELKLRAAVDVVGPTLVCRGTVPENAAAGRGVPNNPSYKAFVVDRATGRVLFETPTAPTMISPVRSGIPMAWVDNGLLSFESSNGLLKLKRWSAENPAGAVVWEAKYTSQPLQQGAYMGVSPVFAGKQIIAGESAGVARGGGGGGGGRAGGTGGASLTIRSFDSKTGELQWATPVPGLRGRAIVTEVAEGRVYVLAAGTKGVVMGLNAADGKVLWTSDSEASWYTGIVRGTVLYTLRENNVVTAYDGLTGKELWHTELSKDCDPAKSKLEKMRTTPVLILDKDRLLATINTDLFDPTGQAEKSTSAMGTVAGIAVLDLQTGKQSGYFNEKGVLDKAVHSISDLQVYGDVLIARDSGCLGINRNTLKLEWYIPASSTVTADGALYVNTITWNNSSATEIVAVPLEAPR